jgi:hypothetical protein
MGKERFVILINVFWSCSGLLRGVNIKIPTGVSNADPNILTIPQKSKFGTLFFQKLPV